MRTEAEIQHELGKAAFGTDEHAMPQRIAEDRIPYKGPSRPDPSTRQKRMVWGVLLFVLFAVLATLIVWMQPGIH